MSRTFLAGLFLLGACSSPPRFGEGQAAPLPRSLPERVAPRLDPAAPLSTGAEGLAADDLEAHVRHALAHNLDLAAAHRTFEAAVERGAQARSLPDPKLTWIEFVEELQTRTGPHSRRLMLTQAFPWPGVLGLRGEIADRRAEAIWFKAVARALQVRREVEEVWHELGWLNRVLHVHGAALGLLQQLEPVVQRRVETGGAQEDLLRLQIEVAREEDQLAELHARRGPLEARLAAAMGPGAAAGSSPALSEPDALELSAEQLFELALEHNPDLAGRARDIARLRAEGALARKQRYPDLSLGADYLQVDPAANPGTQGSGDDPIALRLSLSLPIWSARNDAREREAWLALRAAQLRLEHAQVELRAQLETVLFRRDDARRDLALYRDSLLPRARATHTLTLASYRAGSASVRDLIESEQLILEFELQFWNASRNVLQQEARLRALAGGSLR